MKTSKHLILSILLFVVTLLLFTDSFAAPARLVVEKGTRPWSQPAYAPGDSILIFTTTSQDEIWRFQPGSDKSPERVAKGEGIGRRFVFETSALRVVYKQRAEAHPNKAERLVSTSLLIFDPTMKTGNNGNLSGPYRIADRIAYRESLTDPLYDTDGTKYEFGPYYDKANKKLTIKNSKAETVFSSDPQQLILTYELSPDGKFVAVLSDKPDYQLFVIQCEDGTRIDVGNGWWPSWSANSKRLVWISTRTDSAPTAIGVFDVTTRRYGTIKDIGEFSPDTPSLNSNGTKILFVHDGAIYETDVPER